MSPLPSALPSGIIRCVTTAEEFNELPGSAAGYASWILRSLTKRR